MPYMFNRIHLRKEEIHFPVVGKNDFDFGKVLFVRLDKQVRVIDTIW